MAYPKIIQNILTLFTRTDDLQSALDALSASLLDKIYPVGSVYMSFTNKSPAEFLGGTWEALNDGRCLICTSSAHAINTTGGTENVTLTLEQLPAHNHEANCAENGGHSHARGSMEITGKWGHSDCAPFTYNLGGDLFAKEGSTPIMILERVSNYNTAGIAPTQYLRFKASNLWSGITSTVANHAHSITIGSAGSGNAHSNMQPYRVCYMWKRTK